MYKILLFQLLKMEFFFNVCIITSLFRFVSTVKHKLCELLHDEQVQSRVFLWSMHLQDMLFGPHFMRLQTMFIVESCHMVLAYVKRIHNNTSDNISMNCMGF